MLPAPYYQDSAVTIYHADNRHVLPFLGRFDLLLTDPPYGLGEGKKTKRSATSKLAEQRNGSRLWVAAKDYGQSEWDDEPASDEVLALARSCAEKQIIWGGNYYSLPPCKGPLVWDKENGDTDFADGEMAWNNLGCALRIKRHLWNGMARKGREDRWHPTQKPLDVITWALSLAGDVQTILDPWAGSGTTGEAAKLMGKTAVLIEREERYCEIAAKRLAQEVLAL